SVPDTLGCGGRMSRFACASCATPDYSGKPLRPGGSPGHPKRWTVDPQVLLPPGAGLVVEQVQLCGEIIHLTVRCEAAGANCPDYGFWSEAFHSGYERNLGDLPIAGRRRLSTASRRRTHVGRYLLRGGRGL